MSLQKSKRNNRGTGDRGWRRKGSKTPAAANDEGIAMADTHARADPVGNAIASLPPDNKYINNPECSKEVGSTAVSICLTQLLSGKYSYAKIR